MEEYGKDKNSKYKYNILEQNLNEEHDKNILLTENKNLFEQDDLANKKKIKIIKFFLVKIILIFICTLILLYPYFTNYYPFSYFKSKNPIKIAIYIYCLRYGGMERVTALLLNLFAKEKNFAVYLITYTDILEAEYSVPNNIRRISLKKQKIDIFRALRNERMDILISDYDRPFEIERLNRLKRIKVIYCSHSAFFYRIYHQQQYRIEDTVYQSYKSCKYVVTLLPLENDYLFKKWGINSVLIENPTTFEYDSVIPSDLSQKNLIMIGRGDFPGKRFEFGLMAMKYIIQEVPESQMYIISAPYDNIIKCINYLNLENHVNITGYIHNVEPYLKNVSLHLLPSLSESFSMVLSEAKIYGVPTILCGLDYLLLAKGGTVMVYDENPETMAKEAIKILKDDEYRKKLGKEARDSMAKHTNEIVLKKWTKLLSSVYNGIDESSFSELFKEYDEKLTEDEANKILNTQLFFLKKRIPSLSGITLEQLKYYSLI